MTYAEEVDALLNRLPVGAYLKCLLYAWAVCWYGRDDILQTAVNKDRLVALQRAVRRMENE